MTDKDKKSQSKHNKKDADSNIWDDMMADVTPLRGRDKIEIQKKNINNSPSEICKEPFSTDNYKHTHTPPQHKSNEIDHKTATRLRRGQMSIEARLDLHGMTQNQAYDALLSFILCAHSNKKRCVLVITGKGNKYGSEDIGVLKQKTPEWLNSSPLQQYILKIQPARPNHGGDGALYVLLRRNRD